jgi:hypothetical protein
MPGYSGTPLPKKLGIKDGFHVSLVDAPNEVVAELKHSLDKCSFVNDTEAPLDFAMVFIKSAAVLNKNFKRIAKQLGPAGMLWVSWPKKSSGMPTDLTDNVVRENRPCCGTR